MYKKDYLKSILINVVMFLIYTSASSTAIAGGNSGGNSYEEGPYDDCSAFEDSAYKECIFELNRAYNNYNASNNNHSGSNDSPLCVVYSYPGGYYARCY